MLGRLQDLPDRRSVPEAFVAAREIFVRALPALSARAEGITVCDCIRHDSKALQCSEKL